MNRVCIFQFSLVVVRFRSEFLFFVNDRHGTRGTDCTKRVNTKLLESFHDHVRSLALADVLVV